jgi:hypothetical protein
MIFLVVCLSVACAPKRFSVAIVAKDHPATEWENGGTEEEELDPFVPTYEPLTSADPIEMEGLRFAGVYREGAKTSFVSGSPKPFATVSALRDFLPDDDDMRDGDPVINKTAARVEVERLNVKVTAWVYAAKFEDDNDFHVIIGTKPPGSAGTKYFNVEISGLPKKQNSATSKLRKARKQFLTMFSEELPTKSSFKEYVPLPVIIEGSLYYDRAHGPEVGGPSWAKPGTAWEIHPVTKIRPQ